MSPFTFIQFVGPFVFGMLLGNGLYRINHHMPRGISNTTIGLIGVAITDTVFLWGPLL